MDLNDDGPEQNPDPPSSEVTPSQQNESSPEIPPAEPAATAETGGRSGPGSSEPPARHQNLSQAVQYLVDTFVEPLSGKERSKFGLEVLDRLLHALRMVVIGFVILGIGTATTALVLAQKATAIPALFLAGAAFAGGAAWLSRKVSSKAAKQSKASGKSDESDEPTAEQKEKPPPASKPKPNGKKKPKKS